MPPQPIPPPTTLFNARVKKDENTKKKKQKKVGILMENARKQKIFFNALLLRTQCVRP